MSADRVEVHLDLDGDPVQVGTAYFHRRRQETSTTFSYRPDYIARRGAFAIDPALPLATGAHHVGGLPGAFSDAAPDRWGRNLIVKQLRGRARRAGGTAPGVDDVDFLLGVSDLTRQGALRFRLPDGESFLAEGGNVPKIIELPALLRAAERVSGGDGDELDAVKALLDAGTGSLGGARPKASVRAVDGTLSIAKFPHGQDAWDVSAWEHSALELAEQAGLRVPPHRLVDVGGRRVLLVARFDRGARGRRIPYASAMTLLQARDGDHLDYMEIADVVADQGVGTPDLDRLFTRAVFGSAIRNTDDHLRNHGFLRVGPSWELAPVFDVNPNPDPASARQTSIGGAESAVDEPAGLARLAEVCRLAPTVAASTVIGVVTVVETWPSVARSNGITSREIDTFAESLTPHLAALRRSFS